MTATAFKYLSYTALVLGVVLSFWVLRWGALCFLFSIACAHLAGSARDGEQEAKRTPAQHPEREHHAQHEQEDTEVEDRRRDDLHRAEQRQVELPDHRLEQGIAEQQRRDGSEHGDERAERDEHRGAKPAADLALAASAGDPEFGSTPTPVVDGTVVTITQVIVEGSPITNVVYTVVGPSGSVIKLTKGAGKLWKAATTGSAKPTAKGKGIFVLKDGVVEPGEAVPKIAFKVTKKGKKLTKGKLAYVLSADARRRSDPDPNPIRGSISL